MTGEKTRPGSIFVLALMSPAVAAGDSHNTQGNPTLKSLPSQEQAAWRRYFKRSDRWRNADRKFIDTELKKLNRKEPAKPPYAQRFGFDPKQAVEWYAAEEGRRVADIIVSF